MMLFENPNEASEFSLSSIDYETAIHEQYKRNVQALKKLVKIDKDSDNYDEMIAWYEEMFGPSEEVDLKKVKKAFAKEYQGLEEKIKSCGEKWELDSEYIRNKLKQKDEFLILSLAKDPSRQTFHQHYAARWINQNLPFIEKLEELPSSGKKALYVDKGVIRDGGEMKKVKRNKSIDFSWGYSLDDKNLSFYATHKYTKLSGGSQDNQYEDVQSFLEEAQRTLDDNEYMFAILDGPYYQNPETKVANNFRTRIEFLNEAYGGRRCKATTTNRLLYDMLPVIQEWISKTFPDQRDDESIAGELAKISSVKQSLSCGEESVTDI